VDGCFSWMSCPGRWSLTKFIQKSMKARTILALATAAITLTSTALGDKYGDLVAKGYRWATVDGLYACVSKDDVRRMVGNHSDEVELKMVEQVKAYFLTPGTIVQVTEEDPASGLSKIRMAGITVDLWTLTRFLSKHAVKDTYGVVETPETSGLIPTATSAIDAGPTPEVGFSPVPGTSPVPDASLTPATSPAPDTSPTPGASPTPTPETNQ
jgi:hypothetical protein